MTDHPAPPARTPTTATTAPTQRQPAGPPRDRRRTTDPPAAGGYPPAPTTAPGRREPAAAASRPTSAQRPGPVTVATIAQLKRDHPIATVVAAAGVALRPSGARLIGGCPFHEDTHPSLVVYPATDSFYCDGCRAGGDVITFIRRHEGLSFLDAVARLGGAPPRATGEPAGPAERLTLDDRLVLTAAAGLYHETLLRHRPALAYLAARGVRLATVRRCRLGYCNGTALRPYLERRRLGLRRATELGLLWARGGGETLAGRITVPELRGGQCIWMLGRALREQGTRTDIGAEGGAGDDRAGAGGHRVTGGVGDGRGSGGPPKYFGLALPKPLLGYERVQGRPWVLVVEGAFDYLTGVGWGLPVCALLGTHVRAERLAFLERTARVAICFDADDPGRQAAASLAARLGERAVVVPLPAGVKDLSELGRRLEGRARFAALLRTRGLPFAPSADAPVAPRPHLASPAVIPPATSDGGGPEGWLAAGQRDRRRRRTAIDAP